MKSKLLDLIQLSVFCYGVFYLASSIRYFYLSAAPVTIETSEEIVFTVITGIVLISAPLFIMAIRLQHKALKIRKLHAKVYYNANMQFASEKIDVISTADETNNRDYKTLITELKKVADVHHCDAKLRVYHSNNRYFNIGRAGKVVTLSISTKTMFMLSQEQLLVLFGEGFIFNELETQGLFNEPEDPSPSKYIIPVGPIMVYVLAIWLHFQSKRLLKQTDKVLNSPQKISIGVRQQQYLTRFNQENISWINS